MKRAFSEFSICTIWACLGLAFSSCKQASPQSPSVITLGKRDYVWSRDTLFYQGMWQTAMQSMYGSSPNNVYVVGHCEDSRGRMWHYDGSQWQPVLIPTVWGYLNAIAGTNANNIWVVGAQIDSTLIARFNGVEWTKITGFPRRGELWCVTVLSPTTVFAAGAEGILYRLNGSNWELYEVGRQYFISSIAAISANEAYAIGHVDDNAPPVDSAGSYLFQFNGSRWNKIDSVMLTPNPPPARIGGSGVYTFGGTLYTLGGGIYRREGPAWARLVTGSVGHMQQSGANHILAVGQSVLHFNGIDWKEFSALYPVYGYDCFADGKEIFIVGNNGWQSFVIHGK